VIRPETIALVRDRTDIVAVIGESVTLKRRGRSFVGLCPFHKEKTPSFHVNPDKGFFHCFGCKEGGSAIDFVMKHDGLTFPEAVRLLAERCGVLVEEDERPRPEVDREKRAKDDLYSVTQLAATFFEEMLRTHPERQYALEELGKRGLVPGTHADVDDALQAFRIGYAPPAWDGLAKFLRDQKVSPVAAEQVGLLVPRPGSGHYDRFRHRLMFAVMDTQGRVVAFSGRALRELEGEERGKDRDPPPKYLNSPESPIYSKGSLLFGLFQARHAIRQEEQAVLVEGNFDVVSLHARGMRNVAAPLGTAFTTEQAKLLRRFAPKVILFFDADSAGRKATRASREPCKEAGLSVLVATPPAGMDPDELVRQKGKEGIEAVLAEAHGLLEHLIDEALDEGFAQDDVRGKVDRVDLVVRLLSQEEDPLVRATLKSRVDQLAGRLDLARSPDAFRALEARVRRQLAEQQAIRPQPAHDPQTARIHDLPGRKARSAIVGAVIEWPELLGDPEVQEALHLLEGESAKTVAVLAQCLRRREGAWDDEQKDAQAGQIALDTGSFLAQMPPAIQAFASRRLAAPEHASAEEARTTLLMNASKLRDMHSRDASEVQREMKHAEDFDEKLELARELLERSRKARGIHH